MRKRFWLLASAATALLLWGLAVPTATAVSPWDPPTDIGLYPQSGAVRVTWADPRYDPNYVASVRVDARPGPASCTAAISATSCTVTGLENGVAYTFAVYAIGVRGYSYDAAVAGPAWPCCSVPAAPGTIAVEASLGAAVVSWAPPTNAQAAGPDITYAVDTVPPSGSCVTKERSCRVEGLIDGTGYIFQVTATNQEGPGPPVVSALTTPLGPPGPPVGVQVFLLDRGRATVSWIGPEKTGGEVVDRYVAVASPGGQACVSRGILECTVTGLANGRGYRFTVTAYNARGAGPQSTASSIARPLAGPGKVLNPRARVQGGGAIITWRPPRSSGGLPVRKYLVRSSPAGASCTTESTSCRIESLRPGTRFTFTVQALNAKGRGLVASTPAIAVPAVTPPSSPSSEAPSPTPPAKPIAPIS